MASAFNNQKQHLSQRLSNKEICDLCFESCDPVTFSFTCLLCPESKTKKTKCNIEASGYNNLISHLGNIHGDSWVNHIHKVLDGRNPTLTQSLLTADFLRVDSKSKNLFDWIDLVASLDVPLCLNKLKEGNGALKGIILILSE